MVLFFPLEQELDCINSDGKILGKIKYDGYKDEYHFFPDDEGIALTDLEEVSIAGKIASLTSGKQAMPISDED